MKKTYLIGAGTLMLMVSSLTGCGGASFEANTFKIGFSGPLTGDAANYGLGVKNGAQIAVDEINAQGGINGKKISMLAIDDQCVAAKAGQAYNTLYEKGMQLSLGCVTSACCIEYNSYANRDRVFCLTPSATSDNVTKDKDNIYQLCFSDSGQGVAAANYLKTLTGKSVGLLYDSSDSYSKGIYDTFVNSYGTTGLVTTSFTKDTNTVFTTQINQLKNCDVVFLPIYYTQAALFLTQGKDILKSTAMIYGCDGLDGIDKVLNVNSFTQEISYLSHFNSASQEQSVQTFVSTYTTKYGTETLNQFGASAYDCIKVFATALKEIDDVNPIDVNISAKDMFTLLKAKFDDSNFKYDNGVTGSGNSIKFNKDGTVNKTATKYIVNPK